MHKLLLRGAGFTALLLSLSLTACGGGGNTKTVAVTGNDQMQYSVNKIEASAPVTLTVDFENVGKSPKNVMDHNFVILKPGTDPVAFGAKCMTEGGSLENEHLPPAVMGEVLAHTKLLGPGEKASVTVELATAGTYPHVCTFPGHAGIMKGEIVVK